MPRFDLIEIDCCPPPKDLYTMSSNGIYASITLYKQLQLTGNIGEEDVTFTLKKTIGKVCEVLYFNVYTVCENGFPVVKATPFECPKCC